MTIISTDLNVYDLKVKVTMRCFIFGTEFLKFLKYCKGGGGEVEEKGGVEHEPDQINSYISDHSVQQILKINLIF